MKLAKPEFPAPDDAADRQAFSPVICYPPNTLTPCDLPSLSKIRESAAKSGKAIAAPRDAACIDVPAGSFFRITSVDGPQVGDLNLWNKADLSERFYSGKTRALHGTHLSTGDRMWSSFPA